MNINANEILFLNRMRKMNENSGVNGETPVSNPVAMSLNNDEQVPETSQGLRALMFQGMNNVANDPQLTQATEALKNTLTQPTETTNDTKDTNAEYVIPYASNLAFQGGKGHMVAKLRQGAISALGALTVLAGTPGLLTSCEKDDVPETYQYVSVTINQNSSIEELVAALASGQQVTNQLLAQILQNAIEQGKSIDEILTQLGKYEGMMSTVITLLTQNNKLLTELKNDMNTNDAEMLAAIIQLNESVNTVKELIQDYPQYKDEFNTILQEIQSGNVSINELKTELANLYAQMAANGDIEKETLKTVQEILASNKSDSEKLLEALELLKSINVKLDVVTDQLKEIYKNDQKTLLALSKLENTAAKGVYQQAIMNRMMKSLLSLLQKSSAILQDMVAEMIIKLSEVTDKQDITNERLEQIANVTSNLYDLGEQFTQEALHYLEVIGFDMNKNSDKAMEALANILQAIKENNLISNDIKNITQKGFEKVDSLDANQKAGFVGVTQAISNIKVDSGKVDLSSLKESIDTLIVVEKQNGAILSSIGAKIDLLNITAKSIEAKLSDEFGKNDARYTNIMNGINALKANSDKYDDAELLAKLDLLLAKLDDIAQAIQDHNITIDVTGQVNCNCNCGENHEGILSDINQVLGTP